MTQPHPTVFFEVNLGTFEFMPACNRYLLIRIAIFDEFYLMSKSISFPDGPSDGVTYRVPAWIKTNAPRTNYWAYFTLRPRRDA